MSQREKSHKKTSTDFITRLPENLKEIILNYLPTKEAIKTSVLSKQWRNTWTTIPKIDLLSEIFNSEQFERIIDLIFSQHNGFIHDFQLNVRRNYPKSALDRWISNLKINGIKILTLNLSGAEMPSSFFSCDSLNEVILLDCSLKLPLGFEGFKHLISLELLEGVDISKEDFEKLVLSSPKLESLVLTSLNSPIDLKIHGPNLRKLYMITSVLSLEIYAPKLGFVDFVNFVEPQIMNNDTNNNFIRAFASMYNVEELGLGASVVTYLSHAHYVVGSDLKFPKLKYLFVELNFEVNEIAAMLLYLLEKSPNMETLHIVMMYIYDNHFDDPIINIWSSLNLGSYVFKGLKLVTLDLYCFDYDTTEITFSFLKMIFTCSPNLKKIHLRQAAKCDEEEESNKEWFLSELEKLRETSVNAQVVFEGF